MATARHSKRTSMILPMEMPPEPLALAAPSTTAGLAMEGRAKKEACAAGAQCSPSLSQVQVQSRSGPLRQLDDAAGAAAEPALAPTASLTMASIAVVAAALLGV